RCSATSTSCSARAGSSRCTRTARSGGGRCNAWYGPRIIRTMAPIIPAPDAVAALVPEPHSILWRYGDDARLMAAAGYTLLLQVAHPMVGAAVKEHSNFREEPWKRLMYTLDYVY